MTALEPPKINRRIADVFAADGSVEAWRVPMNRLQEWIDSGDHLGLIHPASKEIPFTQLWRDLWYVHTYVSGGDIDDEIAERRWIAISLRDLRVAPAEYPRLYQQAEWEVVAEFTDGGTPPVNGDGLYERTDAPPVLVYQFHGLSDERVLDVGDGASFAIYALEMIASGTAYTDSHKALTLSKVVNALRVKDGRRELQIAEGDPLARRQGSGLIIELEDESTVTL